MRRLFPALLLLATQAAAQSLPIIPQNPPGLRWQEVRTPHFRVLYPVGFDTAAQRTAQRLEAVHGPEGVTLGVQAKPIAVVMQTQTTVSNGFVTFLPRHAEFFTTPEQGQGLGTVDWLDGLVVHEFRHVNQFDKARQGFGRVLVPLLGEGGLGVSAVGVPQWFFEGDAVGTETAFTRSGRGRIPAFGLGLRANLLSGRQYSYQKAVNGSLRDLVPDWYVLGYFMTSYAKTHYGPEVWSQVLDKYYRFPFYPFSFSNGLRRTTGLRVEGLYQRTMHELDSTWRAEQAARPAPTPVRELAGQADTRVFTQYQYPQYVNDSTILALKSGLGHIPQLVLLGRHGREKRVFTLGPINIPEMISVGGGKAVWPEFRQNPRWGQKVFSELKILDLGTGRVRRLGWGKRYRAAVFSPHVRVEAAELRGKRYSAAAFSPDGKLLVAVRTDASYHHQLVIIDAASGQVLQTVPNPRNDFYQQPRWADNGNHIIAVALSARGKTVQRIAVYTNSATDSLVAANLLPVANVNLTNPQPWRGYVLYNSPQTGIDNVFAVDTLSGKTYQVTNRPFGAYHAAISPDGRHLAFHDYRATGTRIVEVPLDPATWTPVPATARTSAPADPYAERLAAGEPAAKQITQLLASPDSAGPRYGVRRYRPLAHAFRIFSYGVVQSPAGNAVSVGVRSQDFLSTTQAFAGLTYDQTERTFAATGALSYQGLGPVFDVEGSYGGRDASLLDARGNRLRDQWQVARLLAGARLPLVLTRSKYLQSLTLGAYYLNERVYDYDLPVRARSEVGPNTPLHAIQTSLSYASQLRQSARDVAPRAGATLLATYRTTPFSTVLQASQAAVQGSVYLPGFGRHHSLRLRGGYQYQQQAQYNFSAAISYPRAETSYLSFDRLAVESAEYYLPLAFTHWQVGRVLYVQRLRATAFADLAQGNVLVGATPSTTRVYRDFYNIGADFMALFNVFHLRTPVEAGVRVAYSSSLQQVVVQPLAFSVRL
jgi:hypothetical protein